MKDTLDAESKQALVQYRLERGVNSLEEAQYMAKGGYYNAAINRLYYACYYAVVALLLKNDIPAQTHHGVRSMLGLHFTSKGKLSMDSNRHSQHCLRKGIAVTMMTLYIVTGKW